MRVIGQRNSPDGKIVRELCETPNGWGVKKCKVSASRPASASFPPSLFTPCLWRVCGELTALLTPRFLPQVCFAPPPRLRPFFKKLQRLSSAMKTRRKELVEQVAQADADQTRYEADVELADYKLAADQRRRDELDKEFSMFMARSGFASSPMLSVLHNKVSHSRFVEYLTCLQTGEPTTEEEEAKDFAVNFVHNNPDDETTSEEESEEEDANPAEILLQKFLKRKDAGMQFYHQYRLIAHFENKMGIAPVPTLPDKPKAESDSPQEVEEAEQQGDQQEGESPADAAEPPEEEKSITKHIDLKEAKKLSKHLVGDHPFDPNEFIHTRPNTAAADADRTATTETNSTTHTKFHQIISEQTAHDIEVQFHMYDDTIPSTTFDRAKSEIMRGLSSHFFTKFRESKFWIPLLEHLKMDRLAVEGMGGKDWEKAGIEFTLDEHGQSHAFSGADEFMDTDLIQEGVWQRVKVSQEWTRTSEADRPVLPREASPAHCGFA